MRREIVLCERLKAIEATKSNEIFIVPAPPDRFLRSVVFFCVDRRDDRDMDIIILVWLSFLSAVAIVVTEVVLWREDDRIRFERSALYRKRRRAWERKRRIDRIRRRRRWRELATRRIEKWWR